jgi:hypothetical protein
MNNHDKKLLVIGNSIGALTLSEAMKQIQDQPIMVIQPTMVDLKIEPYMDEISNKRRPKHLSPKDYFGSKKNKNRKWPR